MSKSAVQTIRSKHFNNLEKPTAGRPPKLTDQNKRYYVRAITSGAIESSVTVAKKLENELNVKVSDRTVRNALKEAGLKAVEKMQKPKLSQTNIKARLDFAKSHQHWTVDDWKHVIWSDETKINRFCSDGRSWYWSRDGESLQKHHVNQTVKQGGGSIMIWRCITVHGPGFMCKIDGSMDQHTYKQILTEELLKTIEWYDMDAKKVIFQHDNDPKHKAKSVQEWLNDQEFEVLKWPAQSPDLNPIENLWAILKRRLNQYEQPPRGMVELWERVQAKWDEIDKEMCMKLIESMPRRIDAVLKSKGMWTNY